MVASVLYVFFTFEQSIILSSSSPEMNLFPFFLCFCVFLTIFSAKLIVVVCLADLEPVSACFLLQGLKAISREHFLGSVVGKTYPPQPAACAAVHGAVFNRKYSA